MRPQRTTPGEDAVTTGIADTIIATVDDHERVLAGAAIAVEGGRIAKIETAPMRVHVEQVTSIPLGQYRSVIAHRRSLRGVIPGPALFHWNVEKA